MKVLVTGGAGFIGTHLVRRLISENCSVVVLDSFSPQIHGATNDLPGDLKPHVELYGGDLRNGDLLKRALRHCDAVVHLAAETGTGQSMYEISRYEGVNIGGTATLLEHLVAKSGSCVQKIVLASSRAVYGEGKYQCDQHGVVFPAARIPESMRSGQFEPLCPHCQQACHPLPTDEAAPLQPMSFYALTKQVQEQMVFLYAKARRLSAFALRYQNVYGPGQSLVNPYTGILAVFSNLARSGAPIEIFEDGEQSRDFVFIDEVVEATWRCIHPDAEGLETLNVGTGQPVSVLMVARQLVSLLESSSKIVVSGAFRSGDIRHNFAEVSQLRSRLGFQPRVEFRAGIYKFLDWALAQDVATGGYVQSLNEMREKGLLHG